MEKYWVIIEYRFDGNREFALSTKKLSEEEANAIWEKSSYEINLMSEFGIEYWINFIVAIHFCHNKADAKRRLDDLRAGKNSFELMFNNEEEEE